MINRYRIHEPSTLLRIGMAALLAASLVRWFVLPAAGDWLDLADGLFGLLTGVAIGALLQAVRFNARRGSGTGERPCS